jgi:hypothetical protein
MATLAPAAPQAFAMASPMPRLPPEMKTVLPESAPMSDLQIHFPQRYPIRCAATMLSLGRYGRLRG